jgi:hypothetical protein
VDEGVEDGEAEGGIHRGCTVELGVPGRMREGGTTEREGRGKDEGGGREGQGRDEGGAREG